jgi:light-regulated signal transduction histidine kinase (bacteriophytochrome)
MPAGSVSSQAYVILPFLLWAVFRFGSREATMAVVLVSGLAIWGTVHGYGPFIRESLNESLLLLQAFVCVIAITVMALAGALAERRQAEEALARQAQKLARSNAELEQFAYVVSHDLRAPLRALNNYSLFLQEDCAGQLDETGLEYIQGIVESVQQMDALVVDLLEYSRIGRTAIELSAVDAGELLERVVTRLGLREQAEVRLPADLPTIQARELRLEQIFSNLLSNAVKFHRASATPVIAVECADRGEVWEFSVRDNGIGIHEKHFERIFGLFQRLHTSEEYEGTGIGLAIVKKAVEEHGGQVRVQSTPGEGSIFTFTLPKHIKEA